MKMEPVGPAGEQLAVNDGGNRDAGIGGLGSSGPLPSSSDAAQRRRFIPGWLGFPEFGQGTDIEGHGIREPQTRIEADFALTGRSGGINFDAHGCRFGHGRVH